MSCNLQEKIRRGKEWRVDYKSGFERTQSIEHSRLQDTIATGYLSTNIDLTFVILLFYLCILIVIFVLKFYFRFQRHCNASLRMVINVVDCI